MGLVFTGQYDAAKVLLGNDHSWWLLLTACSLIGPLYALAKTLKWSSDNWASHPIAKGLAVYCNNNTSWVAVASDINIEFRRYSKHIRLTYIYGELV